MGYRFVRWLSDLLLSLFYRRHGVLDPEKVPLTGPLVVCANHHGSLVDPMALLANIPRRLRPLAKAPLFDDRLVGPFLRALGALPVYRPQDRHLVQGSNQDLLRACREALGRGECILIFPEGISKPEPTLSELRPGAARMALAAEAQGDYRAGVRLLPVGIHLDHSAWFRRGKVLLQVGDPIAAADLAPLHRTDPEAATRELTARLEHALRALIVDVESTETLRLLRVAVKAWARERGEKLDDAAQAAVARDFARGYRSALAADPAAVARLRSSVEAYAHTLEHFRITGDEVDLRYTSGAVATFVLVEGTLLAIGAPLGILGALVHWPPFRLTGLVAGRLSESEDVWASVKLASSVVIFPLYWIAIAVAVWLTIGLAAALASALALPLLGFWAVRFRDRQNRFFRQVRAFFLFAGGGGLKRHLKESRRAIHDEVERLRAAKGGDDPTPGVVTAFPGGER
jgi:1-acyl-sn-glycerol-3-phosphate acyltransferase